MSTQQGEGESKRSPNHFDPPAAPVSPRKTLGLMRKFEDFGSPPATPRSNAAPASPVASPLRGRRLGEILVAMGLLTPEQVQADMEDARLAKDPLGRYLVRRALINPQQLCKALSLQSGLPVVDFPNANVPVASKYVRLLDMMVRHELIPFSETDQVVCIAARRPPSPQRMPEIEKSFGKQVRICLAPDDQISAVLNALGAGRLSQKRRHDRYKLTMPVWLQLCGERGEEVGPRHGGQILDVSLSGLKVEAPAAMIAQIKELRRGEPHMFVRFSTPPLAVHGTCVVRYARRKDVAKPWETVCLLGLEFKDLAANERDSYHQLHTRAQIASQRLEVEFGPATP